MKLSKWINYWTNICWNGQGNMVTESSIVNHNLVHKLQIIVMVSLGLQISSYISLISRPHKELCILRHELPTPATFVKPWNSIIPLRPSFPPTHNATIFPRWCTKLPNKCNYYFTFWRLSSTQINSKFQPWEFFKLWNFFSHLFRGILCNVRHEDNQVTITRALTLKQFRLVFPNGEGHWRLWYWINGLV
jgi:hypothetical protein